MRPALGGPVSDPVGEGMTAPVAVRRTTEEEWEDLRAVRLAMLLDAPMAFGSTYARERDLEESTWRSRAAGTAWLAWAPGADGREAPVGSVTLWHAPEQEPGSSWLVGMWVAAHARGTGTADVLVEAVMDEARRQGLRRVLLEVAESNPRAAAAYRRLGFAEVGERSPSHTHACVTEVQMERLVATAPPGQGPAAG